MASNYGDTSGQGADPNYDNGQRDQNPATDAPAIGPTHDMEDDDLVEDIDDDEDIDPAEDPNAQEYGTSGQSGQEDLSR